MDYLQKYKKYKSKYLKLKQSLQLGGHLKNISSTCIQNCLHSHSQNGDSFKWLEVLGHGRLLKVELEYPINSGNWRPFDDKLWLQHCTTVGHDPGRLAKEHIKTYIDPATRTARLRFYFADGTVQEPTPDFYHITEKYFKDNKLCGNK